MEIVRPIDPKAKLIADRFRRMADDVERNADAGFGGAFVVVPPENGGEPFDTLILGASKDPGDFYVLLTSKCKTEIAAVDAANRQGQAFGRR